MYNVALNIVFAFRTRTDRRFERALFILICSRALVLVRILCLFNTAVVIDKCSTNMTLFYIHGYYICTEL